MLVGLTGGIACGKTTVAAMLAARGFEILDTDEVAHACLKPGGACYDDVVAAFGRDILNGDGTINRSRLGREVFSNEPTRKTLEAIMHPVIRQTWRDWADDIRRKQGLGCVVIPLLFEVGAVEGWDAIVCVSAPEQAVLTRLRERGHTEDEARGRLRAQWGLKEKEARSDFVIRNNGTIEDLEQKVEELRTQLAG